MDGDTFSRQNPGKDSEKNETMEFTGTGTEYFKIWIVNILLTVLTLGIYNAWAKVRTKTYFYRNTHLAGSSFKYLATPWMILKGQIIAAVFFIAVAVLSQVSPLFGIVFLLALLILIPWVIVRSLMFNAYNSAYRNIRFGFKPAYGESYAVAYGWYFLTAITLGLLLPVWIHRQYSLIFNNHTYGKTSFRFHATSGQFYAVYIKALIAAAGIGLISYMLFVTLGSAINPTGGNFAQALEVASIAFIAFFVLSVIIPFFLLSIYVGVSLTNLAFNKTTVGDHSFNCKQQVLPMVKIIFVNSILVLITLGIYMPWAKVNITRYTVSKLSIAVEGSLDSIIADEEKNISSTGQGLAEAFDISI